MIMRRCVVLFIIFTLVLAPAAACGDSTPSAQPFVFTPYPYTIVPLNGTPVPWSISTEEGVFAADEVIVTVNVEALPAFTRAVERLGFETTRKLGESPGVQSFLLRVPVGSVPDAITVLQRQPGVMFADMNSIRHQ